MPAYLFVNVTITDPVKFRDYGVTNAALVAKMGGKYLVLGSEGIGDDCLEGTELVGKKVISEWPSREAALAYWHSPEYAQIRKLRDGICEAQVMILDGAAVTSALPPRSPPSPSSPSANLPTKG